MSARLAHPLWRINESSHVPLIYISILIARNVHGLHALSSITLYRPWLLTSMTGEVNVIPRTRNHFYVRLLKSWLNRLCTYNSVWKRVWWGKSWWKTTWKVEILVLFFFDSITCQDFDRWHTYTYTHMEKSRFIKRAQPWFRDLRHVLFYKTRGTDLSLISRIEARDCHPSSSLNEGTSG